MRILLVNKFHYWRGGSETYYFALGEALKALGHEVIYFSMQDERNLPCAQSKYFARHVGFEPGQGVAAKLRSALGFVYSPSAGRRMAALIKAEKPDAAQLNLVHRHLTFSVVNALKKHGVPMAFTMHDLIAVCPCYTMLSGGEVCERCVGGHIVNCVKRRCVRGSLLMSALSALEALYLRVSKGYDKVSLFIAPSRFYKDKLTAAGFTKRPIEYMCNFLPLGTVYECAEAPDGYLMYSGRLSPEKGLRTLLSAYAGMDGDTPLYVAGDGPERGWAEAFIKERGLEGRVNLLGHQSRESMASLVSGARALIVPSEWYENCPYSVMEAMAKGKPVLGSRIGGIPELVKDGVTGFLFEPSNEASLAGAIRRLRAMDAESYARMCNSALAAAKSRFDAMAYAKRLTEALDQIAAPQ